MTSDRNDHASDHDWLGKPVLVDGAPSFIHVYGA